jgi:hypothetical protein
MQPKILSCIPEHLWKYVQNLKAYFDLNMYLIVNRTVLLFESNISKMTPKS